MNWIELDDRERLSRIFASVPESEPFGHSFRSVDGQADNASFFSAMADRPGDSVANIERYSPFTIYDFMTRLSSLWRTAEFDDVLKKIVTAAALKHDPFPCRHHAIYEDTAKSCRREEKEREREGKAEPLSIGVYEF